METGTGKIKSVFVRAALTLLLAVMSTMTARADDVTVTDQTTEWTTGNTYNVTSNVTISTRITVSGTVTLNLGEGATLTASRGIELSSGNQLTIDGTGKLIIDGCAYTKSGIGAYEVGTLIVNGGNINVTGGQYAAGIGGDRNNANGGTITINGGVVNATGGVRGAGIGGGTDELKGNYGQCGTITINGGQVTATGGINGSFSGPGIGPGYGADYSSGSVTLGWTNTTDFIYASSYSDKISTLAFTDGKNFVLDGTAEAATTSNIGGKKIIPLTDEMVKKLDYATVSGVRSYYLYTGSEIPLTYTVTDFVGTTLTLGTDYTLAITLNGASATEVKALGNYTMTFTGTGNYTGTKVISFTVGEGIPVTSETTSFEDGMPYKVYSDVAASSRITVSGTAMLFLGEGATLTASKGIELSSGNQLTIDGTGTLIINDCSDGKSGIGADKVGTLIINGGNINVTGGLYAAGIGGDQNNASGGTIIINGGVVNAIGGGNGAGIGGGTDNKIGNYGQCGDITINGGQVTATGLSVGRPGIGPGYGADYNSGSVTLGWTNTTDFICVSSYSDKISTLAFADGKYFLLDGTTEAATTSNIGGKKIIPLPTEELKEMKYASISGIEPLYLYTGSAISITPVVKDATGTALTFGTDYTLAITLDGASVTEVKALGNYSLTFTGTGNYTGTKVISFIVDEGFPVTSSTTTFEDGIPYKVYSDVTVSSRITVSGTAKLILGEGATLTAPKGIELSDGNELTINGTGTLTINDCDEEKSGIGAYAVGTLIINGGNINVTGGKYAAGIGGDRNNANGGTITINGGVVNATGDYYGAGIGGGDDCWVGNYGQCGTITINGGQVTATGNDNAPGIGPGYTADFSSGSVTLGWTNTTDFIYSSNSSDKISTLAFADGKYFLLDGTTEAATKSNYGGKKIIPFTGDADKTLIFATVSGIEPLYLYTGSAISITPVVKDVNGNTLTLGTDYTLELTQDGASATEVKALGNYAMTFTAKDGSNYTDSKKVNFSVGIPAPTDLKQIAFTANTGTMTWTENGIATRWTLQYSTSSDFSSNVTTVENIPTTTYTVTGLSAETTYYVRVKSIVGSAASDWCTDELYTTATKWLGWGETERTAYQFPTDMLYKYSLSQQIYTAEEIGQAGLIQSIVFLLSNNSGSGLYTRTLDVYMVHTDKTEFENTSDWIQVTEADKVFSGSVEFAKGSWSAITLDKPFAYNGTSNLALIIDDNTGNYVSIENRFVCYDTNKNQGLCYFDDNTNLNPTEAIAVGSFKLYNYKNQLRIDFGWLQLADYTDNSTIINDNNGKEKSVQLAGRTLYRDGDWNTLCLPFDVTIVGSPLDGADVRKLSSGSLDDGTLTLNFTEKDAVTAIEAGKPYIIKWGTRPDLIIRSAAEWEIFARNVNNGTESYEGKLVKLGADIDGVSTMVGAGEHRFKGTFDGDGHKLDMTLIGTAQCTAPFRFVEGATIKNLRTTGFVTFSVTGNNVQHASGLVGSATGVTIENCRVSMNIQFPVGTSDVYSGGIIGHCGASPFTMTNCLFDGSIGYVDGIMDAMTNVGGLVGWGNWATANITHCLNAGTFVDRAGLAMIARGVTVGTITDCYSTTKTSSNGGRYIDAGTYTTATGSDLLALLGDGWEISGNEVVPKNSNVVLPDILNPVFSGVTISSTTPTPVTFTGGKFVGTYSPVPFTANDKSILFLGANNTLYYPNTAMTINAFRAYFDLDSGSGVKEFKLNFGEEGNEVDGVNEVNASLEVNDDSWYSLDGRKLGGKPTQKGIYIVNGKKIAY